ncbi:hypothetical protein EV368DRAFT_83333 [Lentinula lateritia]|uniref:Uncharacterized protein n=1 Tax=Lentinula aff. lateritia TaxID=2804960 RepID=A0ACC1U6A2_9AGAR|nr:hypothetical protein F5876DRAFT_74967 [Lentinula aff. lateritia]KAJ3851623.1 hypothetical protein EV368DRAFT_83333 [Lentinula lateritia]
MSPSMRRVLFLLLKVRLNGLVTGQVTTNISRASSTIVIRDSSTTSGVSSVSPSLESMDQQPTSASHTAVLVPTIIAVILLLILCMGFLYYHRRRWGRKTQNSRHSLPISPVATPSILSFSAGYSNEGGQSGYRAVPNPYTYYIPPPSLVRSTTPDRLTVSTSCLSLPKSLYEPGSADTYSPAAPSSEMNAHMPSVEHAMAAGGKTDVRKPLRLEPLRRVDSAEKEEGI